MIYILETKLSETDSVNVALNKILGLGKYQSLLFCKKLGYSLNFKVKELSKDQLLKLLKLIELSKIKTGSELIKARTFVTNRLVAIKCYRGLRKIRGLPIRGQRTHTNSKTAKKVRN